MGQMINPSSMAMMIPIIALMIPIVAILATHQRKMAEVIHGGAHNNALAQEVAALRQEIAELRQLVHQQALSIDSLSSLGARTDA